MRTIVMIVLLIMIWIPVTVQAEPPEYTIMRTTEKIVIDGILDENDWEVAKPVGNFQFFTDYHGDKQQSEVKVLWDDNFLYVAYRVHDRYIWGDNYDTNSRTCEDDCVEIFWNPNPEAGHLFYMFEMNFYGNLLSVCNNNERSVFERESRIIPPHIAQTVQGTVNNNEDSDTGWILEIAIRFEDYTELSKRKTPRAGDMWRVGFNRLDRLNDQDRDKNANMLSAWASTKGFYDEESFGKLIFSERLVHN